MNTISKINVGGVEYDIRDKSRFIEITYDDLVSLRDDNELIAGSFYRITDYITTTSEANSMSAKHPFDIIVVALNENTLSEEAYAIQSERDVDGYFSNCNLAAWKIKYCLDNDTSKFRWASNGLEDDNDIAVGFSYDDTENLYQFDNWIRFEGNYKDDGLYYDRSEMNELISHFGYETDSDGVNRLTLYGRKIAGDLDEQYEDDGLDTELKYYYIGEDTIDGVIYDVWLDYSSIGSDSENIIYTLTKKIIRNINATQIGKGVIYYMKDEYGNECPYDFKNIMFNRKITDGVIDNENGIDTFVYTFSWIDVYGIFDDVNNIYDFSIKGNNGDLTTDEGENSRCYGNEIGNYYIEYAESDKIQYGLNDNVFISNEQFSAQFGTYNNKLLNDCYSNSFGDNCYSNSFGNNCVSNSFEGGCSYNSFGDNCHYNSFIFGCDSNSFGNNCYSNSFGDYCSHNSFGDICSNNTFGCSCSYNSFGNNCVSNSFGNNCDSNSFDNYCSYNSFKISASKDGELRNFCSDNIFENGVIYVVLYNTSTASESDKLQNVTVCQGVSGTNSNYSIVNIPTLNANYQIRVANDLDNNILVYNPDTNIIKTSYSELVELRDNSKLIPGAWYRITDYITTTSETDTMSAGHQFDVLVLATDIDTLSEEAKVIQHDGDTYFNEANLDDWKIWYCLNNDNSKFRWADITNGKGVIYRMIDEYGNECPYDFKNIMYYHDENWYYTFGGTQDGTVLVDSSLETEINTFGNIIKGYVYRDQILGLNHIILKGHCRNNIFESGCTSIVLGNYCRNNTFGMFCHTINLYNVCSHNTFGNSCYKNELNTGCENNTFGNRCHENTLNGGCENNTFGNSCYENELNTGCVNNTFGNSCYKNELNTGCVNNTFGNSCYKNELNTGCVNNTFGNSCFQNIFGSDCVLNMTGDGFCNNTFGNSCFENIFKIECYSNIFGDLCVKNIFNNTFHNNTFGNKCYSNTFSNECSDNELGNECNYNTFNNRCSGNKLNTNCDSNTFGNKCINNELGEYSYSNIFGNYCSGNKCMTDVDGGIVSTYHRFNIFGDNVINCTLINKETASANNQVQYYNIRSGVNGETINTVRNLQHETIIGGETEYIFGTITI